MTLPDFSYEIPLWQQGFSIIGIDEVGRGAFAGPVGVGGVVFSSNLKQKEKEHLLSLGINDSKKLSKKRREELSLVIKKLAQCWHISLIPVSTINKIGIGKATYEGMREVIEKISFKLGSSRPFSNNIRLPRGVYTELVERVRNDKSVDPRMREDDRRGGKSLKLYALVDGFEIPDKMFSPAVAKAMAGKQKGIIRGDSRSISIAAASIIAKVERDKVMTDLSAKYPEYGFEAHKGYGTLNHRNALKEFGPSFSHRTQFIARYI